MRKIAAVLMLLFGTSLAINVTHKNLYVAYEWPVPSTLIADSSCISGDTIGHSFCWSSGPVGIVGSIVQHIDPNIFSSPVSWAFEEAMEDKYLFEAYDPSLEISYVAYFDSIRHDGIPGYILGAVFKIWDDANVYFQEYRYFGCSTGYGVELFMLTDTMDIVTYYSTYDSICASMNFVTPSLRISMAPNPICGVQVQSSGRIFLADRIRRASPLFDVMGRQISPARIPIGIYLIRENSPK